MWLLIFASQAAQVSSLARELCSNPLINIREWLTKLEMDAAPAGVSESEASCNDPLCKKEQRLLHVNYSQWLVCRSCRFCVLWPSHYNKMGACLEKFIIEYSGVSLPSRGTVASGENGIELERKSVHDFSFFAPITRSFLACFFPAIFAGIRRYC